MYNARGTRNDPNLLTRLKDRIPHPFRILSDLARGGDKSQYEPKQLHTHTRGDWIT